MYKRGLFDYASVTPVDKRVAKVMYRTMLKYPANPSSLYSEGVAAYKMIEVSRLEIAEMLEAHADEIIFTSGGTEANNLAIKGIIEKSGVPRPHILSLAIEHPSVREVFASLDKKCDVTYVEVGEDGIVDAKEIKKALRPETVLVSVMYANNEIGTIQPISEIAKVIRLYKKEHNREEDAYPFFHTDASQAGAYCGLRTPLLNVDLMTLDGGKVYGPRGIGLLFARRRTLSRLATQLHGGGQEHGLRAGTENLPAIVGFAEALKICVKEKEREVKRLTTMRDSLIIDIQKIIPSATINGSLEKRLPNNINICIPGVDAEFLVLRLDVKGIAVSSVTSCRSKSENSSSYVIEEMGKKECATSSLRISLGRFTKNSEIKYLLKQLQICAKSS